MSSVFGIEASRAVLFVIAFAIILALVALFGVVLRKLTGARLMMPGSSDRARSRQPRLGIVDVYDLDRQRQLLLLRRDNVEHLLLIGGPNDVVIETNIVRVAGARLPASSETGQERFEPGLEQAARSAQVEASGRPSIEAQLAAQLGAFVRRPSEESDVEQELSAVSSVSAPVPAHSEPILKPDAVTLSAAPAVQGLRAEARAAAFHSPQPAPAPVPTPVVERQEQRPVTPPPFQSRATPTVPAPPVESQPQPASVEVVQASGPRSGPDAAVLSNMAKQLEEALKRPAPAAVPPVQPAPVAAAPYAPQEEVADEDDLLEPTPRDDEALADYVDEAPREADLVEEPAPPAEPVRPAPEPTHPAPSPLPPQPAEPAASQSQKAADPFSVEDIEAEFARLLGRPLDPGKKG